MSPNVPLTALPTFNQVGHVPYLAGGCSTYAEGLFGATVLQKLVPICCR